MEILEKIGTVLIICGVVTAIPLCMITNIGLLFGIGWLMVCCGVILTR